MTKFQLIVSAIAVASIIGFIVSLVVGARLRRKIEAPRRSADVEAEQQRPAAPVEPPRPVYIKCHVKEFRYADGHVITKHSHCGGYGLDGLTDEEAQKFHHARLAHVGNSTHSIKV